MQKNGKFPKIFSETIQKLKILKFWKKIEDLKIFEFFGVP